jgi:NAD(P)-dependent dehydrogenase (short-subunit alcohol dehydrogenase family)
VTSIAEHADAQRDRRVFRRQGCPDGLCAHRRARGAKHGIRANCVSPGYVATPMQDGLQGVMDIAHLESQAPLGKIEADDVANGIAWMLAPASRWVSRTSLVIDAGITLHIR